MTRAPNTLYTRFPNLTKDRKSLYRAASTLENASTSDPNRPESVVQALNTMCGVLRGQFQPGLNRALIKGLAPGLGSFHLYAGGFQEMPSLTFAIGFHPSAVSPVRFERTEFVLECWGEGIVDRATMGFKLALDILVQATRDQGVLFVRSWPDGGSLSDPLGEKAQLQLNQER